MLRLNNPVQTYAWGSETALAELLGRPSPGGPEAELWLGAHPSAPSMVAVDDTRLGLDAVIAADPQSLLGAGVAGRYATLPFLLKVLAVARPLSLQAHPNLAQAQAGFSREEAAAVPRGAPHRTYRDANHKPELICALTPFEALAGFRTESETATLFSGLGVSALVELCRGSTRERFCALMTRSQPGGSRELVTEVSRACATRPVAGFERECAWAVRLAAAYPGDVGVVGALMLNLVTLEPSEALYLPAGNLHAYLGGLGVELMASSDNVLRGGLTPKHIDLAELLRVLDFEARPPRFVRAEGRPEAVYLTPVDDFRLSRIEVETEVPLPRWGPDLLLCVEGAVGVRAGGSTEALTRGASVFVGASEGPLQLSGRGTVFRATAGHR